MAQKRQHVELDPDYEDVSEIQSKKRKVFEESAKHATQRRIKSILEGQFSTEIDTKEKELLNISERLELARSVMDRLRACVVAEYFGKASQQKTSNSSDQAPVIHPTVRKHIGKAPVGVKSETCVKVEKCSEYGQVTAIGLEKKEANTQQINQVGSIDTAVSKSNEQRSSRYTVKRRVIIGNVSKSIPSDQRDENDQATHKWMLYVRGPKDSPQIHDFVKKVWFFLHPSYRPNDLVEVSEPPFHLTRRGWGEFPVRVQLHFKDERNKRLDIIHNLKLDRTYTGLQTLGAETVVDVELEKDPALELLPSVAIKQEPMEDSDTEDTNSNITETNNTETNSVIAEHDQSGVNSAIKFVTPISGLDKSLLVSSRSLGCLQSIVRPPIISTTCHTILVSSPAIPQSLSQTGVKSSPSLQPGSIGLLASNLGLVPTAMNGVINHVGGKANKSGKVSLSPKTVLVSPIKNANTLNVLAPNKNVPAVNTIRPVVNQQNVRPANQNLNSNIYFVKYVDNQGKTILIPQQMYSTGVQISADKSVATHNSAKGRSQPVIPVLNFTNSPTILTPPKVVHSPASTATVRLTNSKSVLEAAKPIQPLIIKQEPCTSNPVTNILLPLDKNMQALNPGQNSVKLNFLPRQAVTTVKAGTVTTQRSQLKVTSQGLIHVPNANGIGPIQKQNKDSCVLKAVSNPQITLQTQPQIILQPNNNKVLKGKSLLSNLTLNSLDKGGNQLEINTLGTNKTDAGVQSVKFSVQGDGKIQPVKSANNFLIVPVSQQTFATSSTKVVNNTNSATSGKMLFDMKNSDKQMLIVVQNDVSKTSNVALTSTPFTSPTNVTSILSKPQSSTIIKASNSEQSVMISTLDQKEKQVILVQDSKQNTMKPPPLPVEREKKIISIEPKKKKVKNPATFIKPICIKDYHDLRSLIQAAVIRHPVVSESCSGSQLHPYCARSTEEWLSWNIGKKRASEWQRASTVQRFIRPFLDPDEMYNKEKMWTVKQIVTWCRQHAYSPHYQEQPLHPTSVDVQSDHGLGSSKDNSVYSSLSASNDIVTEIEQLHDNTDPDSSDEEVEIVQVFTNKHRIKTEIKEEGIGTVDELIPPLDGQMFVDRISEQIGIKYSPTEVSEGMCGHVTQGVLYKVMERFMEDIVRATFALQVNSGRYPDMLTVKDIFSAAKCLPFSDFLSNRYFGVEDGSNLTQSTNR